jgi:hypothetical protein
MDQLDVHLFKDHNRKIESEELRFESEADIKVWLNELQKKQSMKYIKNESKVKNKPYALICHRSSIFKRQSSSTGKMNLKKGGTIKSDHVCTSRVKVEALQLGYRVVFIKTHSGHANTPSSVGLVSPQKKDIAEQLMQGVPKHKILDKIRTRMLKENGVDRLSLSHMQDIKNIARKFNINSDVKLDENDALSVAATVKKLQMEGDNGVFFYQPQGLTLVEYPELKQDDFVLAYMSLAQEELLRMFGSSIICIDGTHGTNAYGFEMTTLITIDDQHQGFPTVFFFHSSKSEAMYEIFFRKLKDRVGQIQCKVSMSDDEPAFYNAWESVNGAAENKLLCAWHVLRNCNKHLLGLEATTRSDIWKKNSSYYARIRHPDIRGCS